MTIEPVPEPLPPADLDALCALNEAAVPAVNALPAAELARLLRASPMTRLLRHDGQIDGLLLVLTEGLDYGSLNYRWFAARYPAFAYVDRIVIRDRCRGRGLGEALYQRLFDDLDRPVVACEVNLEPPNPGSLNFHQRLGFREVGQQATEGGRKRVCLLVRESLP